MIKKISILLILGILLGGLNFIQVFAADATKVAMPVSNPSFEDDIEGWSIINGTAGMISFEKQQVYHQNTSLKVIDPASDKPFELRSGNMTAVEGLMYQAKVRVFQVGRTTGSAYIYINFYDDGGNRLPESPQTAIGSDNFSVFQDFADITVEGVAPKGTVNVSVSLITTSGYIGTVYFDDVRMWVISPVDSKMSENKVVSSDVNELKLDFFMGEDASAVSNMVGLSVAGQNGSLIAWESSAPEIIDVFGNVNPDDVAREVILTATVNYGKAKQKKEFVLNVLPKVNQTVTVYDSLKNPDFEENFNFWEQVSGEESNVSIADGNNSSKSLGIKSDTELIMVQSSPVFGEKGLEFAVNADVWVEKGEANLEIRFYDKNNKILGKETKIINKNDEWETVQLFKAASDKTAYMRLVLYPEKYSSFKIDNIIISDMGYILENTGFESGLDGYSTFVQGEPKIEITDTDKFSQEKSLHIVTDSNESFTLSGLKIPVVSGEKYSAYAKCLLNNGTVLINIEFLDENLKVVSTEERELSKSFKAWDDLGVRADAPLNSSFALIRITISENTDCYLDDLYLGKQFSYKGVPLKLDYLQAGAISKDSEGNDYLYTVVADESANKETSFVAVDLSTKETVKDILIPGSSGSFNMITGKDNNVYIGSQPDGKIYKYIPGSDSLIDLGVAVPGETHIFGLDISSDGTIYGGTYPNCYVFKYDPKEEKFVTLGPNGEGNPFDSEEMYARAVAYDEENDVLYVGVGTHAKLYRYDFKTGTTKSVLPEKYKHNSYVYTMKFFDGKLFAFTSPGNELLVMSFDNSGIAKVEKTLTGSSTVTRPVDGKSYYVNSNRNLTEYDYETKTSIPLADKNGIQQEIIQSPIMIDLVKLKDQEKYPGWTYIALAGSTNRFSRYVAYNIETHNLEVMPLDLPGKNYNPRSLITGPDGKIYGSNHLGGGTSVYDPVSNENELYYGIAQAESGISLGDKVYFSCYTQAKIYEYDPDVEWEIHYTLPINPKEVFRLGPVYEQDRPFGSASGDGLLFIGTVPEYGKLGGAIAIYDPETEEFPFVMRNVVQDQAITSLTYKDGILYGGTTVWGGIGAVPTTEDAKFFAFDVASRTKLFETVIAEGKRTITTVEVGPDGKIWGMAEGVLFKYNPETDEIEYAHEDFPEINFSAVTHANPRLYGAQLIAGNDGYMYGNTTGKFFRVNPVTMEIEILRNSSSIFIAKDFLSNIYYSDFTGTWKYSGYDSDDIIINQVKLQIGNDVAYINDKEIQLDAVPYIENDSTMIPLRFVAEAFNGHVSYDDESKKAEFKLNDKVVNLQLNSDEMTINDEKIKLPSAVKVVNGRTILPLRVLMENLDMSVNWEETTGKITIAKK